MLISVVVPCYNEEEVIASTHDRLGKALAGLGKPCEIIYVDDGSRDKTAEMLAEIQSKDPQVRVICLSRNFGHQIAVTAGLTYASGDAVVIIENQLQATDHGHLGQLIAYAAGLEASIVIWVASETRDEHRSTVEWLNSHTDDKVSFFLVRPEVFCIDESKPTVRFELEAGPSEFGRRLKQIAEKEDAPRHEFRRRFWEGLFQYLASNGNSWAKGRNTTKDNWISTSVGKSGVGVNVSMAHGSRMRVEIYLNNDQDKQSFQRLFAQKEEIEGRLPDELVSWERLDNAAASRVAVYRPYEKEQVVDDTPYRRELYDWIAKNLVALRAVAKEILVEATAMR